MNYKEALEEITYRFKDARDYEYAYWDCVPVKILQACKEALEKQIPRQVEKIKHETILGYAVTVHCPFCGGSIWQDADESEYCFRCGQAIYWEAKE